MNQKVKTIAFFVLGCAALVWATSVLVNGARERSTTHGATATETQKQQEDDGIENPPDAILNSDPNKPFEEPEGFDDDEDDEDENEKNSGNVTGDASTDSPSNTHPVEKPLIKIDTSTPAPETMKASLSQNDCQNDCDGIVGNLVSYCKQFCGLTPVQTRYSNCSDLSGLEKDYCLRDIAIGQSDSAICTQVSDKNIRTQCERSVNEEIVDQL